MVSGSRRYGYPLDDAAQVACDETRKFLEGADGDKVSLSAAYTATRVAVKGVQRLNM